MSKELQILETSDQLVALSAADMPHVQKNIIAWCEYNIAKYTQEKEEAQANYEHAVKRKWKATPFKALARKSEKYIVYYSKVKEAVKEGYLIIPNLPLEIFAIRTKAKKPRRETSSWQSHFQQSGQDLPKGEGRYVDSAPFTDSYQKTETKKVYYPTEFDETLEFPVAKVKPMLFEETQKAMALKIFDEIGIIRQQRSDPIICGIILNKGRNQWHRLTFFIGWFINYSDI